MRINPTSTRPAVLFLGDTDHADFRDAAELLRADADVDAQNRPPELIVVAHSRPGAVAARELERLRRAKPLAGVVVLAGSWCEGELRTGQPWRGVHRLHWYEFPAWWRRQLALRAAGYCPDWCRPEDQRNSAVAFSSVASTRRSGIVIVNADTSTCESLADVLQPAGFASVRVTAAGRSIRGAHAAIWAGGQLSDEEERKLSRFCASLAADRTPVITLLDFPRRDRVERAKEIGAVAVLGKPWVNGGLLATLAAVTAPASLPAAA